jgi:cysteine-rich repeat protein
VGFDQVIPWGDASIDADTGVRDARVIVPPAPVCGDGVVDDGEACDDQNGTNGDGCDNDCSLSCEVAADCDDSAACNGVETCSPTTGTCMEGTMAPDGTTCALGACRGGSCAPPGCGDAVVESGEDCDDGNLSAGDGCENDCTFTCTTAEDCDDGDTCTLEACRVGAICEADLTLEDGSPCDRDGNLETREICLRASCLPTRCGDGFVDAEAPDPEECDDDNAVSGDGCEIDCTFTCSADFECADGSACTSAESCDLSSHTCLPGVALPDGTPCAGGFCSAGSCVLEATDAGPTDGGSLSECAFDRDCARGQQCCPTCPGFPGICRPDLVPCLIVMCSTDSSM